MLSSSANRIVELTKIQVELTEQLNRAQSSYERAQVEASTIGEQLADTQKHLRISVQKIEQLNSSNVFTTFFKPYIIFNLIIYFVFLF